MQVETVIVVMVAIVAMGYVGLRLRAQESLSIKIADVLTQIATSIHAFSLREPEIQFLREQAIKLQAEILAIKSPIAYTKVHGKQLEPEIKSVAKFSSMGQSFEMPPEFEKPV